MKDKNPNVMVGVRINSLYGQIARLDNIPELRETKLIMENAIRSVNGINQANVRIIPMTVSDIEKCFSVTAKSRKISSTQLFVKLPGQKYIV